MSSRTGTAPSEADSPIQQVTQGAGRYLLEVYWLSLDTEDRIEMHHIGDRLDVESSSVNHMVSQLAEDGFIDYRKYDGVRLTDRGVAIGERLAWRYCIVDQFSRSVLDASFDRSTVYALSYRLPETGIVPLGERLGVPCIGACEGTNQQYEGCQLTAAVES
jgi:DtxR family Mn-dependent transcriptional regulator